MQLLFFQLEQTVALVQHMSKKEKSLAWHTLQGLVVDKSLLSSTDSVVSRDETPVANQTTAVSANPTESRISEKCVDNGSVSSLGVDTKRSTTKVTHRPVTRSSTRSPVVNREKSVEVTSTGQPRRKVIIVAKSLHII